MRVWNSVVAWRRHRDTLHGRTVGLVPTMGALHRGHLSLVEHCRRENDIAAATIFVNPFQFNDPKDLERYPRTLEDDLRCLENAGVDDVLVPTASELYPNGFVFRVEPDGIASIMEGRCRPGFFQGVTTVVLKLLNIMQPQRAYFGEKDYQQWKVIAAMVEDFFLPVEIVACPTVREDSGLAMSSRNMLLSPEAREQAAAVFRILTAAASAVAARAALENEGFIVDYVEEHWDRRFAAVFLERVRLIDNVPLSKP